MMRQYRGQLVWLPVQPLQQAQVSLHLSQAAGVQVQAAAVGGHDLHVLLHRGEAARGQALQQVLHQQLAVVDTLAVWVVHRGPAAPLNLPGGPGCGPAMPRRHLKPHCPTRAVPPGQQYDLLTWTYRLYLIQVLQSLTPVVTPTTVCGCVVSIIILPQSSSSSGNSSSSSSSSLSSSSSGSSSSSRGVGLSTTAKRNKPCTIILGPLHTPSAAAAAVLWQRWCRGSLPCPVRCLLPCCCLLQPTTSQHPAACADAGRG